MIKLDKRVNQDAIYYMMKTLTCSHLNYASFCSDNLKNIIYLQILFQNITQTSDIKYVQRL